MATSRIKELEKQIKSAADSYYNKAFSIITDAEYDALIDELRTKDPTNKLLLQIGAPVSSAWKKVKHDHPMVSLNKVNTEEEFSDWCQRFPENTELMLEYKYDGISMDLKYENGHLTQAVTRGDGFDGEDIYKNALLIPTIPKILPEAIDCAIGGEIYLTYTEFNKINGDLILNGKKEMSNPRNAAAGIAKRFDGKDVEKLSFVAYKFKPKKDYPDTILLDKETDIIYRLCTLYGFQVAQIIAIGNKTSIAGAFDICEKATRSALDYDIDGMVIKVNNIKLQEELGSLNGNPKGQVAWKFKSLTGTTTVEGIRWSSGRNGRITPVAIVKPLKLGGVTITNISMHNMNIFTALCLAVGDEVIISRRNDVIPYIEDLGKQSGRDPIGLITNCPVCDHKVEIQGEFLMCTNPACKSLDIGTIMKWLDACGIMNIGESTVEDWYTKGIVTNPADLYNLKYQDIAYMGDTMANKLIKNIHDVETISIPKFIDGINITNFGEGLTEKLIDAGHVTIDAIMLLTTEDLLKIKGIQAKTAERIVEGLKAKRTLIFSLLKVIMITETKKQEVKSNKLGGKSFCFTGELHHLQPDMSKTTREMAWKVVEENGGVVSKSVTKTLNYLVQADPNSNTTKTKAARKNGTTILGENEFWDMVK
jgi:DNA ligase (NAD+)